MVGQRRHEARSAEETIEPAGENRVQLIGRLAAEAEARELPSGDVITVCRLIVPRSTSHGRLPALRGATVDTVDCVAWTARVRRGLARAKPGDVLRVEGALRRRFWRSGAGVASRCEVELATVRVMVAGVRRPGGRE